MILSRFCDLEHSVDPNGILSIHTKTGDEIIKISSAEIMALAIDVMNKMCVNSSISQTVIQNIRQHLNRTTKEQLSEEVIHDGPVPTTEEIETSPILVFLKGHFSGEIQTDRFHENELLELSPGKCLDDILKEIRHSGYRASRIKKSFEIARQKKRGRKKASTIS